jgi:hypothetical protein
MGNCIGTIQFLRVIYEIDNDMDDDLNSNLINSPERDTEDEDVFCCCFKIKTKKNSAVEVIDSL